MWGSFGVHIDLPKLEDSEVTMETELTNDPEIEVSWHVCGDLLGYLWIFQNRMTQQ